MKRDNRCLVSCSNFVIVLIDGNKTSFCPIPPVIILVNESDPRSDVHYLGSSENKA